MSAEVLTRQGRIRPALIGVIALLSVVAVFRAGLPAWLQFPASIVVLALGAGALRARTVHRLKLPDQGPAAIDGVAGVLRGRAATPLFVSLELTSPGGRRKRLALFRDELPEDSFRALLSFLRHG
ncbi:MAG: protein YgfX [Candidatus Wenzhouxiangella sp. M2_3B_020]